ncbi:MAG: hypothetical protein R3F11_06220 [Verrucomicrobiales bacterium]
MQSASWFAGRASPQDYRDTQVEYMAAVHMEYALQLIKLEKEEEIRVFLSRQLARSVFNYWYESRFRELNASKRIDGVARRVYLEISITPNMKFLRDVFSDPLDGLSPDKKPELKKDWDVEEGDYPALVKVFHEFLVDLD